MSSIDKLIIRYLIKRSLMWLLRWAKDRTDNTLDDEIVKVIEDGFTY